jgi:hypothetical protein
LTLRARLRGPPPHLGVPAHALRAADAATGVWNRVNVSHAVRAFNWKRPMESGGLAALVSESYATILVVYL